MPKNIVVLGPPGTGKTTSMVSTTRDWIQSGVSKDQVAYLAFTKAAAREAAGRILDDDFKKDFGDRLPYCRTLHSLAYMGLKKEKPDVKVMTTADMKGFEKWSGLQGKYALNEWEDLADVYRKMQEQGGKGKSEWDECMDAYTLSRISARTPQEMMASKKKMSNFAIMAMGRKEPAKYEVFVQKYETYKETNGKVDFTDMLEYALTRMPPIDDVKKVVIDEAQDISPVLFAISDRVFSNAEEIYWAGDDDQSIFKFSAADAALFIARARQSTKIFLQQTHRFGDEIVEFSKSIITRVRDRVKKEVLGAPGREHEIRHTGDFRPVAEGDTLILHRHVAGCQAVGDSYFAAGLPFRNERGKDPLGSYARVQAYKALRDLADGKNVSMGGIGRLIEDLMPSMVLDERTGKKTRLIVHGSKKKTQNMGAGGDANIMDLMKMNILTPDGADAVRQKFFNIFKHSDDLDYYDRVIENGYDLEGECPTITTIHGSKGRQAGRVIAFSEMGQRCWDDPETEHRLAYVAATRTEKYFEICSESTLPWSRVSRYNYPIPKKKSYMTPVDTEGK